MLILALALLALTPPEPPRAGLADAWLVNAGEGSADLWIALDGQPSAIRSTSDNGTLGLILEGFACEAREILPPPGRPVTRLQMDADQDGGCVISLEGQWREAQAFLGEGGVLVALEGVVLAASAVRPVVAQGATQGVASTDTPSSDQTAGTTGTSQPAGPAVTGPADARPTALTATGSVCTDSASRLEDTPWDLNAMSGHADCLAGSGATTDAATLYERVLAFEPGHYGAALGLARLRAAEGNTAAAAALFQTAAESARTDGEALAARGAAEELEDR